MTDDELLIECKKGLNIPFESTNFDGVLTQKIKTVKVYLTNSGVTSINLENDLAVGLIVMGVCDLWNLTSGEVKFSSAFNTLLCQLALS